MESVNNDVVRDNDMKWSSIPLLINDLKYQNKLLDAGKDCNLNEMLFGRSFAASHKYDGTNVGKDEFGLMYGRNQTIASKTKSYQKTPLDCVQKLDAKAIKNEVLARSNIAEDLIATFNVYGELMCNDGLYNYSKDSISKTHQVFGVMIRLNDKKDLQEVAEKLAVAKFACCIKASDGDEENEDEEAQGSDPKLGLYMNETLKEVLTKLNVPMVPMAGVYANFYDLVMANFDWMKDGMGEGLVLSSPADGAKCHISKWKIGAEAAGDNGASLDGILKIIENDTENKIFGDNSEKAKELIEAMLKVNSSRLINGEIPKPKSPPAKKEPKAKKGAIVLSEEEQKNYEEAIASAKTKYDHEDTFYAKGMKGTMEYAALIAKECLNDIKIDEKDKAAMGNHTGYITQVIKDGFIAFNKAKAAKK